jgi:integrase
MIARIAAFRHFQQDKKIMNETMTFEYQENTKTSSLPPTHALGLPEVLYAIKGWTDLTEQDRDDRASAARTISKILLASPAPVGLQDAHAFTCANLNRALYAHPPALFGLSPDRFRKVVSSTRGILRRLDRHAPEKRGRACLTEAWGAIHDAMEIAFGDKAAYRQSALIAFMIYCGRHAIPPTAVNDQTLADYEEFLTVWTINDDIPGRVRRVASNWNSAMDACVPGWPTGKLTRARMRDQYTLPFDAYPPSFGEDVGSFLHNLGGDPDDDGLSGAIFLADDDTLPKPRGRALKKRTIETRGWQIRQAAGTLVRLGVPTSDIRMLADLVQPLPRVRDILRYLKERARQRWQAEGRDVVLRDVRSSNICGIAETLRQIAKFHVCLPENDVQALSIWVAATKPLSTGSMSEKNARRLTALAQPRTMAKLLHLPEFLVYPEHFLKRAANGRKEPPKKKPRDAALDAMYGALMEIGLICPMRRANLTSLHLDQHLQWDAGRKHILALMVPAGEVKNTTLIHWPMPAESGDLIQTYLNRFRPLLTPGSANRFLFPDTENGQRGAHDMSVQTIARVEGLIGAEFNLHLLRHIAVLRYLNHHPGNYETVRLLLGHKSVASTIQFYAGLEAEAAARHYDALLSADRKALRLTALAEFGLASRTRFGRGDI